MSLDCFISLFITLDPSFFAKERISSSSLETYTSGLYLEFNEVDIEYAIKGLSLSILKFFLGIPLEPPLAGIIINGLILLFITSRIVFLPIP